MSRIAVVIPVLNQPQAVRRTLASVDRQAADITLFVVDDGSQPPLELDAAGYRHPLRLIRMAENRGCTAARNRALQEIFAGSFDYVALQDAGDIDIGDRMVKQARFLDAHPEVAVVGGWAQYVDLEGRPLYVHRAPATHGEIARTMPIVSAFAHPASMIRVSALAEVGGYDERFPIASDYELFLRLTRKYPAANLPEVLIHKEDHPRSLSLGKRRASLQYRLKAQRRHFRPGSLRDYAGLAWTTLLLAVPHRLVLAAKRRRGAAL